MVLEVIHQLTPSKDQLSSLLLDHRDSLSHLVLDDYNKLLDQYESSCVSLEEFRHLSRFLLEYAWENLHTGHWKEVALCWRVLYASVRLIRALYGLRQFDTVSSFSHLTELLTSIIEELDYSLLMGYPILDSVATKLANLAHERLTEAEFDEPVSKKLRISDCTLVVPPIEKLPSPGSIRLLPLERISLPSLERFQELLLAGRPFILTGGMTHWPACRSGGEHVWTLEYWQRKVGYRLVPIEIGSRYTDESWGQELMTINRFIERFILSSSLNSESNRPIGYLAQHQLFLQIPELADDVHTPDYCMINGKPLCEESCVDSNVWFGPANTVSPLHHDSERANLLAQVSGQKYVILFTASETPYLYAHSETMLCNTSQVDVEHPDLEAFPLLTNAQGFHGILSPGEMLFIPPRCWHYVRSLSLSFSVNFWWDVADAFIPSWSLAQSAFHGV